MFWTFSVRRSVVQYSGRYGVTAKRSLKIVLQGHSPGQYSKPL